MQHNNDMQKNYTNHSPTSHLLKPLSYWFLHNSLTVCAEIVYDVESVCPIDCLVNNFVNNVCPFSIPLYRWSQILNMHISLKYCQEVQVIVPVRIIQYAPQSASQTCTSLNVCPLLWGARFLHDFIRIHKYSISKDKHHFKKWPGNCASSRYEHVPTSYYLALRNIRTWSKSGIEKKREG